jgi:predicted transcriptional regulator
VERPKRFKHRVTVRLGDEHLEQLAALARKSGLDRNEVLRRAILDAKIPSWEAFEGLTQIQKVQADQNRLGGLLKLALGNGVEKAALRHTLAAIERTNAKLRPLIGRLAERV